MKITLNNAKGKILKTAKTVIREDIEVVPALEKKEINANGYYPVGDGYAGIGEVVVNVTGGGNNSWAGVFSDERTYFVGEVVYYEGGIYERTKYSAMVQLPTNTEYWKTLAVVVGGTKEIHANGTYNITDFASIKVLVPDENSWCGEYDSEVNYKENAIVVYRRMIYLCIKDIDNKQSPDNEEYWDLIYRGASDATGSAGDILEGKVLYGNDGERLTGTMPNNAYREGDYFLELDVSKPSETLYGAYNGTAKITLEEKTITANGTYNATSGKVISKVTVAVPEKAVDEWDGTGVIIAPIPQSKTFTINGTSYRMDNRMTWYAWTRSDYNTDGFACANENDYVYEAESKNKVTDAKGNDVLGTTYIVEGGAYLIKEVATTDELAGTWVFNNTLSLPNENVLYYVNFTCIGVSYNRMGEIDGSDMPPIGGLWLYGTKLVYDDVRFWLNESYKTITITSNLSEVTNGSTLLTWLKANATKQGAKPLISFTIEGTSYQAEEGMTWEQWVESDYNTGDFVANGNSICENSNLGKFVKYTSAHTVLTTDTIISNHAYFTSGAGGAN